MLESNDNTCIPIYFDLRNPFSLSVLCLEINLSFLGMGKFSVLSKNHVYDHISAKTNSRILYYAFVPMYFNPGKPFLLPF